MGVALPIHNHSLFFPRAEQSGNNDLLSDRTGTTSRSRKDFVFIINPKGANGRTSREWKKLLPYLKSRLGQQCNVHESFTSGPSHAVDITREAIREGADAVIAVGGDGTLHEDAAAPSLPTAALRRSGSHRLRFPIPTPKQDASRAACHGPSSASRTSAPRGDQDARLFLLSRLLRHHCSSYGQQEVSPV